MSSSVLTSPSPSTSSLNFERHLIVKSSTYSSWIINEENRTSLTNDPQTNSSHIMWYRFLLVIVICITAVGNILVCLAIGRERKLQNTTNYFLMSLAVADCLVAILVMPMGMISEVLGHFPFPHSACVIFATMDVLCCTSSIWHMSTMSMDRYFTIRFPFRYGRNKTRRIMLWKIITVWAISAAISSPVFVLGILDKQNVLSDGICAPNNRSFKIYGSIFAFYIPFIIMITTYALTMRSLRNVLVNKKKYNRERRRKQTFRPLAQIIHQYAEIAQGIRRNSANKKRRSSTTTTTNNSLSTKTPFTIVTSQSPTDNRAQFFPPNSTNLNLQIENTSTNPTTLINELNQHLTINYIKPNGSKKRRFHQQQQQQQIQNVDINVGNGRTMNNCDMSTLYEITEYSKSTSSSHEVNMIFNVTNGTRRSIVMNEKTFPMSFIEHFQMSSSTHRINSTATGATTTTAIVNNVVPPQEEEEEEEEINFKGDMSSNVFIEMKSSSSSSVETTIFTLPLTSYLILIQLVMRYYQQIFPYRLNRLAIESTMEKDDGTLSFCHRSTSTSSLESFSRRTKTLTSVHQRTISTQTQSTLNFDGQFSNEIPVENSPKRCRFPFHRPMLTSPSLFTNLFRYSSGTQIRTSESSTKSSLSWGQRSSTASSSNPTRLSQQPFPNQRSTRFSSGVFRRIESEMDTLLGTEHRSHGSTSSTSLLHSVYRHRNPSSTQWQKSLKHRQFQSKSAYVINHHPSPTRKQTIPLSSTTNTNSSDSSSILHRYPKFFPTVIHHRHRDDDIVATNERKALRVLMIIFCVFITSWTPFFICTFISAVCDQCRDRITSNMWFSITWLGYGSSMANPFIYTIFSDVFRRAFTNILFCRSTDSVMTGQMSAKFSHPKAVQQNLQMSSRRSPNLDQSRTSTPVPLPPPTTNGGSDATIYLNRCASDSIR